MARTDQYAAQVVLFDRTFKLAEMILATRQSLDDAAFEATMRKALDFDW